MKIGIITELSSNSVNYGNHLQAYAFNNYLRSVKSDSEIDTIIYEGENRKYYASLFSFLKTGYGAVARRIKRQWVSDDKGIREDSRFKRFQQFDEKYIKTRRISTWSELVNSDYNIFIVGSDIVWSQRPGLIRRIKFLAFDNKERAKKISYAASFGKSNFPTENTKLIRNILSEFSFISVREKASVELLASIGISGVVHACDPTLFLSREEWIKLECKPTIESIGDDEKIADKYCFAYLLGNDSQQRAKVCELSKKEQLQLITIPYIGGYETDGDRPYGDLCIKNCSPQEWIWLIHHAQYVITDSFHGLVFSTIFSTNFIIVKRASKTDLNIRLVDYLGYLEEADKYVELEHIRRLDELEWDYDNIQKKIDEFVEKSERFLSSAINDSGK